MHSTGGHSKEADRQSHKLREMIVSVRQNAAILIWLRKETPESAAELLVLPVLALSQPQKQVCTTTQPPQCELQPHVYRSVSFFFFSVSFAHTQFQQLLGVDRLLLQRARETEGLINSTGPQIRCLAFVFIVYLTVIWISISRKKTIKGCCFFFF